MSKLQMRAYYFGFSETGVRSIDEILSAVACAGRGYHHTDGWGDNECCDLGFSFPTEGKSYAQVIEDAASAAAKQLAAAEARAEKLQHDLTIANSRIDFEVEEHRKMAVSYGEEKDLRKKAERERDEARAYWNDALKRENRAQKQIIDCQQQLDVANEALKYFGACYGFSADHWLAEASTRLEKEQPAV